MIPLSEYPRPGMQRDSYVNLNGMWQYAITAEKEQPAAYDGDILVPFSPEAKLSGVERQLQPGQWLHYRRIFEAPEGEGGRVLLHFGAVDYRCKVMVNKKTVGTHIGGYLPFTFDITEALHPGENELLVKVQDPSDTGHQARGKQVLQNGGMFYTAQSGIWQTVWMERVPEQYIEKLKITPIYDERTLKVQVISENPEGAQFVLKVGDKVVAETWCDDSGEATLKIAAKDFHPWSPEDPFLYDLTVSLGPDTVQSYAAMRKFELKKDRKGILRIFLNNKPYFMHGLLDQGYWQDGLYTAPSDEAMIYDIQTCKDMGFNLLRKHIKIEPERWYYHCDRLGMIVWQDMVNGGGKYKMWFLAYAVNIAHPILRKTKDNKYKFLARSDKKERERYYPELTQMIEHLYNHPSIACWVPFNEGWGQFDAKKATELVRKLDNTRLVDEASGWFDQGGGDFNSIHNYFFPLHVKPEKARAVVLSEYGGISWPCPGHCYSDKVYGYGTAKSGEELAQRYEKLVMGSVLAQIQNGLSALVYTQVSDVEDEVNGLMTYDRKVMKLDPQVSRKCAEALFTEFSKCVK